MSERIKPKLKSELQDADMQGALPALIRAAARAREIARTTNTAVVVMRDGKLVEERCDEEVGEKSRT